MIDPDDPTMTEDILAMAINEFDERQAMEDAPPEMADMAEDGEGFEDDRDDPDNP